MKWVPVVLILLLIVLGGFIVFSNYNVPQQQGENAMEPNSQDAMSTSLKITPISHASFVMHAQGQTIFNDPVGSEAFASQDAPNIILLSDIHGDHFDLPTLQAISKENTIIIAPQAVADLIPDSITGDVVVLPNGRSTTQNGIEIEAVPMYNFPESKDSRHTKGRGNGYIVTADSKRVYIAGDTGPTPEMKALKNIDIAFVPMNPPFTMTVEEAAEAVVAFKPKKVHPYHYRGQEGLSDVAAFKKLVEGKDPNIMVELLNFYPEE